MADAYAGFDVARLALDGADAGTTFTDSLGHTFTGGTGATTSTANYRYGTASLKCTTATTAMIYAGDSVDWEFGSGDWDIDFWVVQPVLGSDANFVRLERGGSYLITLGVDGSGQVIPQICWAAAGTPTVLGGILGVTTITGWALKPGEWAHIALNRIGTAINVWFNGELAATYAIGASDIIHKPAGTYTLRFGGDNVTSCVTKNMDMIRVTKGHGRFTQHFIPPVNSTFDSFSSYVTTAATGTYTKTVSVASGEINHDSIIASVDAAIQALGWTLYDTVYKGVVTMIYRVLNKDATTYKYAVFMWDKPRQNIFLTTCESWDTTNRTMTNEAWTNYRCYGNQGYGFANTDIIIFGSSRWLGLMTFQLGSPSLWSMVVELEREAPEDTAGAGYPCWGLINSENFLGTASISNLNNSIALPRTRNGGTGITARQLWGYQTSIGNFGGDFGIATGWADSVYETNASYKFLTHAWDNTKKIVSHYKPIQRTAAPLSYAIYGRAYGIKLAPPIGNTLDKVTLAVDADFFFQAGGTNTDHWILPTNNHAPSVFGMLYGNYAPVTTSFAIGKVIYCMCFTGKYVYLGTSANGVYKIDMNTGAVSAVASTGAAAINDMCFDGKYVYATSTTGVYRIEVNNADAVTSIAVGTGGLYSICWNGRGHLYASQRTAATQPHVHKIDLGTWTAVADMTIGSARTTASNIIGMASDGDNTIAGSVGNVTTAADQATCFINENSVSGSFASRISAQATTLTGMYWTGQYWLAGSALSGAGSGTYNLVLLNNSGVLVNQSMSGSALTSTIVGSKCTQYARGPNIGFCAGISTGSGVGHYTGAVPPDGGVTATASTAGCQYNQQFIHHTGNQLFVGDTTTILYHLTNIYRKEYSTFGILGQTLIPK